MLFAGVGCDGGNELSCTMLHAMCAHVERFIDAPYCREGLWDASFAEQQTFTANPVIVDPGACVPLVAAACGNGCGQQQPDTPAHTDVVQMTLSPDDEFLIIATDGLWCVGKLLAWLHWQQQTSTAADPPPHAPFLPQPLSSLK